MTTCCKSFFGCSRKHTTDILSNLPAADPDDVIQTFMSFPLL